MTLCDLKVRLLLVNSWEKEKIVEWKQSTLLSIFYGSEILTVAFNVCQQQYAS